MRSSLLTAGRRTCEIFRLDALLDRDEIGRLPYALRILLENALRSGDEDDVEAVASWVATSEPGREISFRPARVLLQDFTGVPVLVDLAAMREAMRELGVDAERINPQLPAELVVDHSVQVDEYASPFALRRNAQLELARNRERYSFLRWGQEAFANFSVVPPSTGIVHQVNLEHLARVVEAREVAGCSGAGPLPVRDTSRGKDMGFEKTPFQGFVQAVPEERSSRLPARFSSPGGRLVAVRSGRCGHSVVFGVSELGAFMVR